MPSCTYAERPFDYSVARAIRFAKIALGAHPLGGHRDGDRMERVHGRGDAVWRTNRCRGAGWRLTEPSARTPLRPSSGNDAAIFFFVIRPSSKGSPNA